MRRVECFIKKRIFKVSPVGTMWGGVSRKVGGKPAPTNFLISSKFEDGGWVGVGPHWGGVKRNIYCWARAINGAVS